MRLGVRVAARLERSGRGDAPGRAVGVGRAAVGALEKLNWPAKHDFVEIQMPTCKQIMFGPSPSQKFSYMYEEKKYRM